MNLQCVLKVSKQLSQTQNNVHGTEGTTEENLFHFKWKENTDRSTEYNVATQTPSNLRNSYIPKDLAQVEFCARRICIYIYVAYVKLWGRAVA